jgi:hypothetical protein
MTAVILTLWHACGTHASTLIYMGSVALQAIGSQ